jgi:hypothetical protein
VRLVVLRWSADKLHKELPTSVYDDIITRMKREDFMCGKKVRYKKKKNTNPLK